MFIHLPERQLTKEKTEKEGLLVPHQLKKNKNKTKQKPKMRVYVQLKQMVQKARLPFDDPLSWIGNRIGNKKDMSGALMVNKTIPAIQNV